MARPYKPAHLVLKSTSMTLRLDQIGRVRELAARDNVSQAWIIRDALDIYLRENTCDTCTPSARIEDEAAA